MRYYSATFPCYCTFGVPPDVTDRAIRIGYLRLCGVLGMDPDKRRSKRSASEQRAVSGYGKFIAQIKASQGQCSKLWTTGYTVSDLNTGNTVLFLPLFPRGEFRGLDIQKLSDLETCPWKPPFERALDRLALARSADMGSASDTLQGDFAWLMTGQAHVDPNRNWLE